MGLCQADESPVIETLAGGISNLVVRVRTQKGTWIVKQALPRLRVKDEWLAARTRIFAETACLRLIRDRIQNRPAPAVVLEDRESFACALEDMGDGSRTWKQDLLSGVVDQDITRRVAQILSELHSATWEKDDVRAQFADMSNFHQLRLDPYLATVARRHPDIRFQLEETVVFLREERFCLVHGDFSPKNILLLPDGRIWVIDCEVAHYGNPAFDIAFCANHLILKAVHLNSLALFEEAQRLWSVYWKEMGSARFEGEAVRTLSALMLSRIDGKSPVEYLDDVERERVRRISRALIGDREENFTTLILKARDQRRLDSNP